MYKIFRILSYFFFASLLLSCSDELDGSYTPGSGSTGGIVGTWYGTSTYYNPVGGQKYQYLSITFNANHTGSMNYETPVSYSNSQFTYSVSGKTVSCQGVKGNTDGDLDLNFSLTLKIEGDRLYPTSSYTQFILTKDDSVLTNSNGQEVIDQSTILQQYWMNSTGNSVLKFNSDTYEEYMLTSPFAKTYSTKTSGDYTYSPARKILNLNGIQYTINQLTEKSLSISGNSKTLTYTVLDPADAPVQATGNNSEILPILLSAKLGWVTSGNKNRLLFNSNNIYYYENSGKNLGSFGIVFLNASGTYSISGNRITANFTEVSWEGGNSTAKDYFPGWTYNKSKTVVYTIKSADYTKLIISDDMGHSFTMTPL